MFVFLFYSLFESESKKIRELQPSLLQLLSPVIALYLSAVISLKKPGSFIL